MKKYFLILFLIFILGTFLRLYLLGEIPRGFHRDEAFLGYNAYSLLKTGRDINSVFLPLHLKSFIYSPAGYSYFSIPFIAIFDLSVFSARFASAFFGSLTIILIFFLVYNLFSEFKYKKELGLLSSFLFSISPWNINLARTATENSLVVFFITLGIFLYLLFLNKGKYYFLIFSFISFAITLFIYQAPRAFLPFFIPLITICFIKLKERKKILFSLILVITLIIIPIFFILSSKELSLRIRTVSILASSETQLTIEEGIRGDGISDLPIFVSRMFHNKVQGYFTQFLQNYFSHFSYDFLFTDKSYPDRYKVPLSGLLYLIEFPFFPYGLWALFKNNKRKAIFLSGWILIAPLGSALAFDDVPNLQRTLIIFPALSIISSFGLLSSLFLIKKQLFRNFLIFLLGLIFLYSFLFYLHQYYFHVNSYRPWYRNDGYKELVAKVNSYLPNYKKVIVTDRESAPTIFFLFYSKYDPKLFQIQTQNTKMKDFDRIGYSLYEFSQEECPLREIKDNGELKINGKKDVLYINSGLCTNSQNIKVLDTIQRGDGSKVFYIVGL